MHMDAQTLGCVGSLVYAVGMFSGAALERYVLGPLRERKESTDDGR